MFVYGGIFNGVHVNNNYVIHVEADWFINLGKLWQRIIVLRVVLVKLDIKGGMHSRLVSLDVSLI